MGALGFVVLSPTSQALSKLSDSNLAVHGQNIRGPNTEWVHLAQAKNTLLETLQNHAASLVPAERHLAESRPSHVVCPNEPTAPVAPGDNNPPVAGLLNMVNAARSTSHP